MALYSVQNMFYMNSINEPLKWPVLRRYSDFDLLRVLLGNISLVIMFLHYQIKKWEIEDLILTLFKNK